MVFSGFDYNEIERGRRALELPPPVGELPLDDLAREVGALPHRIVGVLDRQRRQRIFPTLAISGIQRTYLPDQNAGRPAIRGDVMHRNQENVLVIREPQQTSTSHRPGV